MGNGKEGAKADGNGKEAASGGQRACGGHRSTSGVVGGFLQVSTGIMPPRFIFIKTAVILATSVSVA